MQVNDLFHGFRVKSVTEIEEIKAKMWRMEYEKNGADLVWFEREDANANMTFGICFKTVPEDDTGVFHIIEHSVLCGSEKFPVKDPFVELNKTSVNTFLNAMTYNDKTVYPISSCTKKDFLNLMDVYLDAVFHPISVKNPLSFMQEGWHWEIGEDRKAVRNGVVYSEMKGAFAGPDRIMWRALHKELYPDNCYSKDSGGDPLHICDLSYEQYLESHRRYYSASNARIFLDGMIDTEDVFAKLDEELSKHERIDVNADIPYQKPVAPAEKTVYYPIGDGEDTKDKAILLKGWVFADYKERQKYRGASVIFNALCGNTESPLRKAVTDSGLAQDVSLFVNGGTQQISACLKFKNTNEESKEALYKIAEDVFKKTIEEGFDKEELEATLNSYEFSQRQEEDALKGLSNGLDCLDSWLYGGDPAEVFTNLETLAFLREKINDGSGFYEKLLKEIVFDCNHVASIVLLPSKTMGKELDKAEAERAEKASAGWTAAERKKVEDDMAELARFQESDDSESAEKCMPKLSLSDLNPKTSCLNPVVDEICGLPLLRNLQDTNGINYFSLYFDATDLGNEDLNMLDLLQKLFADQKTAKHSAAQILRLTKRDTGYIGNNITLKRLKDKPENSKFRIYLAINMGSLEIKEKEAIDLLAEILTESDYTDEQKIRLVVQNSVSELERAIKTRGSGFAVKRAQSMLSEADAAQEQLNGIEALLWYRKTLEEMKTADGVQNIASRLQELAGKIFCRARLRVGLTGKLPDGELERLIMALPEGEAAGPDFQWKTRQKCSEGIEIPAQIGFAASASRYDSSFKYDGSIYVARNILVNEILWHEIRVKGGAYGMDMNIRYEGRVNYSSYRDPQPGNSLEVYKKCAEYLREVAGGDIESYIIATYGSAAGLMTPGAMTDQCEDLWLVELPFDNPERVRAQILATTPARLLEIAEMLQKVQKDSVSVVIAGPEQLKACEGKLDKITKVF